MSTKRSMPARRAEKNRSIPDPAMPPAAPKGKRGAKIEGLKKSKEPLKAGRKVKK